jgi:hypothetical protein
MSITERDQRIRLKAAYMARTLPIPPDTIAADLRVRMVGVKDADLERCLEAAAAGLESKYRREGRL